MIQETTVEGREATVAYVTKDWEPVPPEQSDFAKITFHDNGEVRIAAIDRTASPQTYAYPPEAYDDDLEPVPGVDHLYSDQYLQDREALFRDAQRARGAIGDGTRTVYAQVKPEALSQLEALTPGQIVVLTEPLALGDQPVEGGITINAPTLDDTLPIGTMLVVTGPLTFEQRQASLVSTKKATQ